MGVKLPTRLFESKGTLVNEPDDLSRSILKLAKDGNGIRETGELCLKREGRVDWYWQTVLADEGRLSRTSNLTLTRVGVVWYWA